MGTWPPAGNSSRWSGGSPAGQPRHTVLLFPQHEAEGHFFSNPLHHAGQPATEQLLQTLHKHHFFLAPSAPGLTHTKAPDRSDLSYGMVQQRPAAWLKLSWLS